MSKSLAISLLLITGCMSKPPKKLLGKDEYALTQLFGRRILCASAIKNLCGLSLSNCTSGSRYECSVDVEIIDMRELDRRARAAREQAERNSL